MNKVVDFNSGITFKEEAIHFKSRALIFPKAIRLESLSKSYTSFKISLMDSL